VQAWLDTNTYPTGIGVTAGMAALPLTRHTSHGEWNYVLHPQPIPTAPAAWSGRPPTPQWSPALLSNPALTGLAPHQMQQLIQTLAVKGGIRRGRPPWVTLDDQVLATVLHLHVNLAVLFGSSRTAMHRILLKIRRLLETQGIAISPAHRPFWQLFKPESTPKTTASTARSRRQVNGRQTLKRVLQNETNACFPP
jgi:hypothetical protein